MGYQMSAVAKARKEFNECSKKKGVKNCRKEKIAMAKAAKQEASKNSRANAKLAKKTGAKIGSKGFKKAKEQDAAAKKIQAGIRKKLDAKFKAQIKKCGNDADCTAQVIAQAKKDRSGKKNYKFHPVYGNLRY
jgi:hypothetical protein